MKKIAILQSNYIPWKGYFDLINRVDEFVIYDDAQYTRRDWRNRNKIKTPQGLKWLTIPVEAKGKYHQKINEVRISDKNWAKTHWQTIKQNYSKARYFHDYKDVFEELYLNCSEMYLSLINYKFICFVNEILGIQTIIRSSSEFELPDGRTEKLLRICQQCGADIYISGPAAINYFDIDMAKIKNIKIEWMDYNNYPVYDQLHPPFEHNVTILDLIFNLGDAASELFSSQKEQKV